MCHWWEEEKNLERSPVHHRALRQIWLEKIIYLYCQGAWAWCHLDVFWRVVWKPYFGWWTSATSSYAITPWPNCHCGGGWSATCWPVVQSIILKLLDGSGWRSINRRLSMLQVLEEVAANDLEVYIVYTYVHTVCMYIHIYLYIHIQRWIKHFNWIEWFLCF